LAFGTVVISPRVGTVEPGSPAAKAGFLPGDVVQKANNWKIDDFRDLKRYVLLRAGEPIRFTVLRGGREVDLVATPARKAEKDPASGSSIQAGYLGLGQSVTRGDVKVIRYGPIGALKLGVHQTYEFVDSSLTYIRRMVTGREGGDQLSGPIGIAGASKAVTKDIISDAGGPGQMAIGLLYGLAQITAMISIAIGFANLLPIPVLDGGHLLFYAYEAVARRPLTARVQEAGYRIGFALLIGLVVFATWNDLQRYRVFSFIGGLFS
jgi:regulator of sigma E protease